MKFLTISKFLLIIFFPLLIYLIAINYAGFDSSFYKEKFSEYNVRASVPNADFIHAKVIDFLNGRNAELPAIFDQKEKQHLIDVRSLVRISTIALYALIALFVILLAASAYTLKINAHIANFIGNVLFFGGFLAIILAGLLFILINSDFSSSFESFHQFLFEKNTYIFDPASEIIVRLYPEQLFMDLGIRISKYVIILSVILILLGAFLILKFKSKKVKNKS